MGETIDILLRSVAVYLFVIVCLRIFGKKELSQLSVVDLVFILLISNSVQNAMVGGNITLLGGLTAAAALFTTNFILKYLLFRNRTISRLIQGDPVLLIHKGHVVEENLKRVKISHSELESAIREHGVARFTDVDLAILELDGNISVLSHDYHRHSKRHRVHKSLGSAN